MSTEQGRSPDSQLFVHSATSMEELPDDSVALMVTSPPYHVGKEYDSDSSFEDYLAMLEAVFAETFQKRPELVVGIGKLSHLGDHGPVSALSSR